MAEGYDGFNVAMGLMADTFDEDEAKRKEARDEQTAIRKENRANIRADEVTKSTRDYNRGVLTDSRAHDRTVLLDKRSYDEKLADKNLDKTRLMLVKDDLAKRGLPYQGVIDVRAGLETIARYDANKPMGDWFIINKDYIDDALSRSPELTQGILSPGPLNIEELKALPPEQLLEVKSRLETPVDTIKKTTARARLMNSPAFLAMEQKINKGMASIGQMWNRFMGPGMAQYEVNAPGSKAAHLAVIGVLNQSEEYENLLTPDQRDLFTRNPHAFLTDIYNQERRGLGQRNLTIEEGAELGDLWAAARSQALGELQAGGSGPGKLGTADKKAAIEFLTKELNQKDMASAREQYIKAYPELLGLFDEMFEHPLYGSLLRERTHTMLDQISKQQPVAPPGQGTRPRLPGTPTPGTPTPGQTPGRPAALGKEGAPLPAPKAVPTAGQSVKVKGGLPAQAKLDAARKYVEGNESFIGGFLRPSRFPDASRLTPDQLLKSGEEIALRKKAEVEANLKGIGAYRENGEVGILPSTTVQGTGYGGGDNVFGDPYGFSGATETREAGKSMGLIERQGVKAHEWFRQLDQINADLQLFQQQAERQTNIKIPSLGSGSRQ